MQPSRIADKWSNHWHALHVAKQSWDELAEHNPQSIHLQPKANRRKQEPPNDDQQETSKVAPTADNSLFFGKEYQGCFRAN